MLKNVYSCKDSVSGLFADAFNSINDQTAIRTFIQAQNDPNTLINSNPQDFALYKLGTFNDESGKIDTLDTPLFVKGAIVKAKEESTNE